MRRRASRSSSSSPLHHRADPHLERCHHEDAQRLALAEDEVRPAPEDDGPAVVGERAHDPRQVVPVLDRAQVAAAGDRGQPVREHLLVLLQRRHHPLAEVRALGDPLDDLAVEEVEAELRGQPPRDLVASGAVLPRDGDDRPPRLRVSLLPAELPAVCLLLDHRLDRACHGLPPGAKRRHPKGRPCQGYTSAREPDRAPMAGRPRPRGRLRGGARAARTGPRSALPVSNDDAILLLMGRHVLGGELATTLWNQPYNGALDAYLLAPLLAVLPHHARLPALRAPLRACSSSSSWACWRAASAGRPRAGRGRFSPRGGRPTWR